MSIWLGKIEEKPLKAKRIPEKIFNEILKEDTKIAFLEDLLFNRLKEILPTLPTKNRDSLISKALTDSKCQPILEKLKTSLESIHKSLLKLEKELGSELKKDLKLVLPDKKNIDSAYIDILDNLRIEHGLEFQVKHTMRDKSKSFNFSPYIIQNMGRNPRRIIFDGYIIPESAESTMFTQEVEVRNNVEVLQKFFMRQEPVYFSTRFIPRTETPLKVLIEKLNIEELSGIQNRVKVHCELIEHREIARSTKTEKRVEHGEPLSFKLKFESLKISMRYIDNFVEDGKVSKEKILSSIVSGKGIKKPRFLMELQS